MPHRSVSRGDIIDGFGPVTVEVLHPLGPPMVVGNETDNETSVVLSVRAPDGTVLLASDVEEDGIAALAGLDSLKAEVFTIPHHASYAKNIEVLAEGARPRVALVSGPEYIRSQKVVDEFSRRGAQVVETWQAGCIDVWLGDGLRIDTYCTSDGGAKP